MDKTLATPTIKNKTKKKTPQIRNENIKIGITKI